MCTSGHRQQRKPDPSGCRPPSWAPPLLHPPPRPPPLPSYTTPTLQDTLFQLAFNQRLYRLSRLPDPPFYAANVSSEALCRSATLEVVSAITPEKGTLRWGRGGDMLG